jgi:hypothetical protein
LDDRERGAAGVFDATTQAAAGERLGVPGRPVGPPSAWFLLTVLFKTVSVAPKTFMMPPPTPSPWAIPATTTAPSPPTERLSLMVESLMTMVAVWLSMPPPFWVDPEAPLATLAVTPLPSRVNVLPA